MISIDKDLEFELGEVTRETHDLNIPVMIIIEGAPASGKSRLSNALYMSLDAKYTDFIATRPPREADLRYPFMHRYWYHLPKNGNINIHFRSWYSQLIEYKDYNIKRNINADFKQIEDDMKNFEKTLTDNGYEILKFYINTDKEVRERHLQKLKDNPVLKWKAEEFQSRLQHHDYDEEMEYFLQDETVSPWTKIAFHNKEEAADILYSTIINRLKKRIEEEQNKKSQIDGKFSYNFKTDLFTFDFDKESIQKSEYKDVLPELQARMREIQFQLYQEKIPLVLVYEGMDAAGKGGNIKRTRALLDPTGYKNNAIGAPTDIELAHHYLWRFAKRTPRSGHIGFFDRSWYGRVLVERVEGFSQQHAWQRAYEEINDFEKSLHNSGAVIIKFFLSLDKDEQLERLKDREDTPEKQWKITDEDWRNREKWDLYLEASEDMVRKTNTDYAPWIVIPANDKRYARITALKTIIEICEECLDDVNKRV
ncbi:MAG: phosphate--AMP phosphotransferase [Jeotgalicoccus sp.]